MKKIIILNGPPASGKDTIAEKICLNRCDRQWHMFKDRLFNIAIAISGISGFDWHDRYDNRVLKESPWVRLPINKLTGLHHTQRSWLMHISEDIIKPEFGCDYFGKAAADSVANSNDSIHVFSDSGFEEEVMPLIRIKDASVYLIRLYRDGCDFRGDSRRYLVDRRWVGGHAYAMVHDIHNNGTIDEVVEEICELVNLAY